VFRSGSKRLRRGTPLLRNAREGARFIPRGRASCSLVGAAKGWPQGPIGCALRALATTRDRQSRRPVRAPGLPAVSLLLADPGETDVSNGVARHLVGRRKTSRIRGEKLNLSPWTSSGASA